MVLEEVSSRKISRHRTVYTCLVPSQRLDRSLVVKHVYSSVFAQNHDPLLAVPRSESKGQMQQKLQEVAHTCTTASEMTSFCANGFTSHLIN